MYDIDLARAASGLVLSITTKHLTLQHWASRRDVLRRDRPVNVDQQARVIGTVRPREAQQIRPVRPRTTCHTHLSARQVQLRTVGVARAVQPCLLEANEVVAIRNASWDRHSDGSRTYRSSITYPHIGGQAKRHTVGRELNTTRRNRRLITIDLEPNIALAIEVLGQTGRLGHVHVDGTRVVDVGRDGEGDTAAGGDGEGLGGRLARVELVAGHGRGGDVLDRAVGVVVCGAAGELPVGAGGDGAGGRAGDSVLEVSYCPWTEMMKAMERALVAKELGRDIQ